MRGHGFDVLRLSNSDIVSNPEGVFALVAERLSGALPFAPTPNPSPQGGGVPRNRKLRSGLKELAARTGDLAPSPPSPLRGGAGGGGLLQNTSESIALPPSPMRGGVGGGGSTRNGSGET